MSKKKQECEDIWLTTIGAYSLIIVVGFLLIGTCLTVSRVWSDSDEIVKNKHKIFELNRELTFMQVKVDLLMRERKE